MDFLIPQAKKRVHSDAAVDKRTWNEPSGNTEESWITFNCKHISTASVVPRWTPTSSSTGPISWEHSKGSSPTPSEISNDGASNSSPNSMSYLNSPHFSGPSRLHFEVKGNDNTAAGHFLHPKAPAHTKSNAETLKTYRHVADKQGNDVLPRLPESVFNARIFVAQFLLHLTLPFSLVALWACYPTWEAFVQRCRNQYFFLTPNTSGQTMLLLIWSWGIPLVVWYTCGLALMHYARGETMFSGWAPELAVTLIAVTLQRGMVAFKYSFLTQEEYDMYLQQPDMDIFSQWSSNFQLITGWILPSPSVVTQELHLAAKRQGLPLEDIFFTVNTPHETNSVNNSEEAGGGGATWADFFDFNGNKEGKQLGSLAMNLCNKNICSLDKIGTAKKFPCTLMCTQLMFRSTYDCPVYMQQRRTLEHMTSFASLMQCLIAPLWRWFVKGENMYEWSKPYVFAFQIMQIPVLFITLWACYMFLVVGALEYTRLAIMMRDLGAMIDTKFGYNPPPSVLVHKPPPRLDLYTYPSNIVSWCSTWLIIDDFGKLFNTRMQACSMLFCFGVLVAAANSILIYLFEGGHALRSLLMPYQVSVLGFWLAVVLLWTAFIGTDLNRQQVQIRNKLLKQQLLSRMDDDEKDKEHIYDGVGDSNGRTASHTGGSVISRRRRRSSMWRQTISESEMNRLQDLLVVSMELLEQDNVKRVAGLEATQQLVWSVSLTVVTLLWLSVRILFFGRDE